METFFVTKVSHRIFGENSVIADGWFDCQLFRLSFPGIPKTQGEWLAGNAFR